LRSPLRHITGYADILQAEAAGSLNETSRHHLETIVESATKMERLIDALLSFSRMGRTELRRANVPLGSLVEQARRELREESRGRKIEWRIAELPTVRGDSTLLRQVVLNLLSNSLKYTRNRNPARIEIGCDETEDEIVVFVRDNGVGFDMRYADKLFGVFQRLHSSNQFEGTGIGLANVRRVIHRHGGRTWATSKVNAGATFYFSLPKLSKGTA
jgi:light-regulated signal transduction histidine kinase (bacteriophytochrome)